MSTTLVASFTREFGRAPQASAVAPGRIEFIGNHTDYNGGLVLGASIDRTIRVAVARNGEKRVRLKSADEATAVEAPLETFEKQVGPAAWANYPLGVLASLREDGLQATEGFDFYVESNLPLGAGLSSSAAFELSTARALCSLFNFELDRKQLAVACRRAENKYVGIPSGILDQGVSAFGDRDKLVRIDCAELTFKQVPMPEGLHFWIFNSNHKHSLVDSMYADRHRECMEALAALQESKEIEHLAELTPAELELSEDVLAEVPRKRARHIVNENHRVHLMESALRAGDLEEVGRLLYASHESSRDLFENSIPELDAFVEILRNTPNVIGARLTGGGFGGAVMALTTGAFDETQAEAVAALYAKQFPDTAPTIFHVQTGEGAHVL